YLYGYRFYRSLDHFCRRASLRCKRGLDVLDHGFKLLVRQLLEQIAVFDLVLARDQQRQDLEVGGRLRSAHPRDSLLSVLPRLACYASRVAVRQGCLTAPAANVVKACAAFARCCC